MIYLCKKDMTRIIVESILLKTKNRRCNFFNKILSTIIRVISFLLTLRLRQTNLPDLSLHLIAVMVYLIKDSKHSDSNQDTDFKVFNQGPYVTAI